LVSINVLTPGQVGYTGVYNETQKCEDNTSDDTYLEL